MYVCYIYYLFLKDFLGKYIDLVTFIILVQHSTTSQISMHKQSMDSHRNTHINEMLLIGLHVYLTFLRIFE